MAASQQYITPKTAMGANLVGDGATFRVWAPGADHVYVALNATDDYQPKPEDELVKNTETGHWTGFFSGVVDGSEYRFFVVHGANQSLKRDPWARELEFVYPDCNCIVRDLESYPWHDQGFRPPAFNDLIVYQFHVGVYFAEDDQGNDIRAHRVSKFLDVLDRVEYLADLGVNALQPLPVVEFRTPTSQGYNETDFFSPEMDYSVRQQDLSPYITKVNALLSKKNQSPLTEEHLIGQVNQLKAFIDICHLYGLAIIVDVVYNHAGGDFDPQSMDYFDLPPNPDGSNDIYFSDVGLAGGRVFKFIESGEQDPPVQDFPVQDFLIGNGVMFLTEYHADGLRFDEVTVMDRNGGWYFCQHLTETLRYIKPEAVLIAEYWGDFPWLGIWQPDGGMGFDVGYSDRLRDAVRNLLPDIARGADAEVDLSALKAGLEKPQNFPFAWQAYNCIENHDLILDADGDHRKPRISMLADSKAPCSWYGRSRSRVALGLLITAPGIPMLFMGQELLAEKLWSDNVNNTDEFIWWAGLDALDSTTRDFRRFTHDLLWVRRELTALRSEQINVFHCENTNRVLAFHRWLPNGGGDVVVVISLSETTFYDHSYELGFPLSGHWNEVFNSDLYDNFPNPIVEGNPGGISTNDNPMDDLQFSSGITLPANSILVFKYDDGE